MRAAGARNAPYLQASKAWARAKLLEQLTTNTLWLAPRAFRTASNGHELENRVDALLVAAAMHAIDPDGPDASDEDEEDESVSDDDDEEEDDDEDEEEDDEEGDDV